MSGRFTPEETEEVYQSPARSETRLSVELPESTEEQLIRQSSVSPRAGSMSSVWSTEQSNPFLAEGSPRNTQRRQQKTRRLTEAHEEQSILAPMHTSLTRNSPIQFGTVHPGDQRIDYKDLPYDAQAPSASNFRSIQPKNEPSSSIGIPPLSQEDLRLNPAVPVSSFKAAQPILETSMEEEIEPQTPNFAASFNFRPTKGKESEVSRKFLKDNRIRRLTPIGIPVLLGAVEQSKHVRIMKIALPTVSMPLPEKGYHNLSSEELQERYKQAIEHAQQWLGRYLPQEQNDRRQELLEEPLDAVSRRLGEALSELEVYEFDNGLQGYRVVGRKWRVLINGFREARAMCQDLFKASGLPAPEVPRWGRDDDVGKFWSANDFEIIAVAARCDIENFMLKIRDVVFWDHQNRRNQPPRESKQEDKEETSHERRDEPPHLKAVNEKSLAPNSASPIVPAPIPVKKEEETILSPVNPFRNERNDYTKYQAIVPTSERSTTPQVNLKIPILQPTGKVQDESSSKTFQTIFQPTFFEEVKEEPSEVKTNFSSHVRFQDPPSDGSGSSSSEDSSDSDKTPRERKRDRERKRRSRRRSQKKEVGWEERNERKEETKDEPRFDHRLKTEVIPTWDGDTDQLARWIIKINSLAALSKAVWRQLGHLVPSRLRGSAEKWYYSLHPKLRRTLEQDWDSLRGGISSYYMNRSYLDKQKIRANRAVYRDSGNSRELPSEYFIRKLELLQQVYDYNERELISEIMAGAPSAWTPILTPHLYREVVELQRALKFHEDILLSMEAPKTYPSYGNTFSKGATRNPFKNYPSNQARVNQVGWSEAVKNPPFPKDDANVSKRGTPVSKGGRPCRHCGSGNHWDYECKYSRKGEKRVRSNLVSVSEDDYRAQEEYDELYYNLDSEDEAEEDFQNAL